jgi:hypothetical protein
MTAGTAEDMAQSRSRGASLPFAPVKRRAHVDRAYAAEADLLSCLMSKY